MKRPRLSFSKDARGKHRWTLTAPNGVVIDASSQGFQTASGARRNFRTVQLAMARVLLPRVIHIPGLSALAPSYTDHRDTMQ